jgi:hypothetical protein
MHSSSGVWHANDFPGQPGLSVESMQSQPKAQLAPVEHAAGAQ